MKWYLPIIVVMMLVPTMTYATHDPTDVGHTQGFFTSGNATCGSSSSWVQFGTAPQPTGAGSKAVGASLQWDEGYHDLDLRLTRPDGVTHFFSQQGLGVINEEVYDSVPQTGTYTAYKKCFFANTTRDTDGQHEFTAVVTYWRL